MAQVLLRDYLDEMRAHLREGQYADVIGLGQHILRYYPKYVEIYRLLAEASLETDDLAAAADLFQRVRSADPENIVALVGLSIVHELRKELEEAIWHLERAFEIQPANAELRKELLRLYAAFEGAPRSRLKLTSGGLARLYARQGLYSQAIQEFRAVLRRDPTRADAQVALAEVLYRVGRKQEAAEVAQSLLEQFPYCLKANLLLGALWSENGVPEAELLLRRAQSLDPEHTVARGLVPDHWDDAPPPKLPAMSEEAAAAAPAESTPLPKPEEGTLHELSLLASLAALEEPPAKSEGAPAPQPAVETAFQAEPRPVAEGEPESPPAPSAVEPVAALSVETTEEKKAPTAAQVEAPSPSMIIGEWKPLHLRQPSIPKIGPTIPGALDKLPAWLRRGAPPIAPGIVPAPSTSTEESTPIAVDRLSPLRIPRLEETRPVQDTPAPASQAPQKAEPPAPDRSDWLARARQAARSGKLEENIAPTSALEEKPAWLTKGETEPPPQTEGGMTVPEWLWADSPTASSDQPPAEPEGTLPAWLAPAGAEGQAQVPSPGAAIPDWLSTPKEQAEPAATEVSAAAPSEPPSSEAEAPPGTTAPGTALPEWLQASSASESQPLASLPGTEMPAWLASPTPTPETPPKVETDDTIPDWLLEFSGEGEAASVAPDALQSKPSEPVGVEGAAADVTKAQPGAEISTTVTMPESAQPRPGAEISTTATMSEPVQPEAGAESSTTATVSEPVQAEAGAETSATATASEAVQAEPTAEISVPATVSEPVQVEPGAPIAEPKAHAQPKEKPDFEPETLLAEARALRASGNSAGALDLYGKIMQKGPRFTIAVIADLEQFAREPNAPMPAHRLLGDAYAQAGRFQEALEQYRAVLGRGM
jgi:tetratricopeptide (TPR) repeat protein